MKIFTSIRRRTMRLIFLDLDLDFDLDLNVDDESGRLATFCLISKVHTTASGYIVRVEGHVCAFRKLQPAL